MRDYFRWAVMVLAVTAAAVALTVRLPPQWSTPRLGHVGDLGHFFLFGGLTLGFWWLLGRRMGAALAAAVVLNAAGEMAQLLTGRHADVADFLRGLAGSLVVVICLHALRRPWSYPRLGAYLLLVLALSAWPILEGIPYGADIYDEYRRFPVLCDFQSPWQTTRWECVGAELRRVESPGPQGGWAGRIVIYDKDGAAVLYPVMSDWSGYRRVCCELSTGEHEVPVTILLGTISGNRIVTREQAGRYGPGACRVTMELRPADDPASMAPMDLSRVYCLILAAGEPGKPPALLVQRVYLE